MKNKIIRPNQYLTPILYFCLSVFVIGFLAAIIHADSKKAAMIAIEWILACLISGIFIGFLFGIPKTLQNSSATPPAKGGAAAGIPSNNNYQQLVNTNLTEISDWLTKIIVGLGLVKLTKIPPYIESLALAFTRGLENKNTADLSFAYGIITCFVVMGFLFGYLSTRLYLASAFYVADLSPLLEEIQITATKMDNIEVIQEVNNEILRPTTIAPVQGATLAGPAVQLSPIEQLKQQADQYLKINLPNKGDRLRLKNIAAVQMASFALANQISKDEIIENDPECTNEGLIITLATMIITHTESGDLDRLFKVADKATRLHVKYRVVNAIGKLIDYKLVSISDKPRIIQLLKKYRNNTDDNLLQKIDSIATLVEGYTGV